MVETRQHDRDITGHIMADPYAEYLHLALDDQDRVEMRELVVEMDGPGTGGYGPITLDGKPLVTDNIDVHYGCDGAEFTIGCRVAAVTTRTHGSVHWRLIFAGADKIEGEWKDEYVKAIVLEDGTVREL